MKKEHAHFWFIEADGKGYCKVPGCHATRDFSSQLIYQEPTHPSGHTQPALKVKHSPMLPYAGHRL